MLSAFKEINYSGNIFIAGELEKDSNYIKEIREISKGLKVYFLSSIYMEDYSVLNLDKVDLLKHTENKQDYKLKDLLNKNLETSNTSEQLYRSLLLSTCLSNTENVNYNKYGTPNFRLKQVSEIFCDNVLLNVYIPKEFVIFTDNKKTKETNR